MYKSFLYTLNISLFSIFFTSYIFSAFTLRFTSYFVEFENADYQDYNEEIYQANKSNQFLNTDDRDRVIYGNLQLQFDIEYKKTHFFLDISKSGYWGSDNLQGADNGNNPILINRLYFLFTPLPIFNFSFGRQFYEIGGALKDYFFADVIDGIIFNIEPAVKKYHLQLMGDIVSFAGQLRDFGIYAVYAKDDENIADFKGDTLTFRVGLSHKIYERLIIGQYFIRYGANTQGGADRTEAGRTDGNKSDNDWMIMNVVRVVQDFDKDFKKGGKFDFTIAYSYGVDNQFLNTKKYNGPAVALNYEISKSFPKLKFLRYTFFTSLGYFHQDFISMKAASMGGLLLWAIKGYYPAPYAYFYHYRDYAKDANAPRQVDATNSKMFISLKNSLSIVGVEFSFTFLPLLETLSTEYMGTEMEGSVSYTYENLKLNFDFGLFKPSAYFKKRAGTNSFLPRSDDLFWGIRFKVDYVLDIGYLIKKSIKKSIKENKEDKDNSSQIFNQEEETIEFK